MEIIGLTGFKRSGKNTFAELLKAEAETKGHTVKLVAYADKLKIAAARALGFDRPEAELIQLMDACKEDASVTVNYTEDDGEVTVHQLTGREYLQFFGTEAGRHTFDDYFWLDLVTPPAFNRVEYLHPGVDLLIVTDVRFDNEAARVESLGGLVVEVNREGFEGDGHASEVGVSDGLVDITVYNNSTIEEFSQHASFVLGKAGIH